jgi:hypothetical protein
MATLEQLLAEKERRSQAPSRIDALMAEKQRRQLERPVPQAPVEDTALNTAEAAARGLAQGATLGFSDELQAAMAAGVVKAAEILPETLGGIEDTGKDFGELFKEGKELVRGRERAVAEQAPVTSTVSEIVGGVGTGGLGVAKAAALGGLKGTAAVVGAAGGLGAVSGAGFSEAEEASQIAKDALQAGAISAVTAGVLSTAIRAGTPLIKKTINSILKSKSPNKFTQAEEFLRAKIQDGSSPELLKEIQRLETRGIAAPIASVTKSPSLQRTASFVAQDVRTEDIARMGVTKLQNTLASAERKVLNKVARSVSTPQEGADVFSQALRSLRDNAVEARRLKAEPLYNSVVKASNRIRPAVVEQIKSFKTATGTTNPRIGQTIDELRRSGQFVDLPDGSMPVLDQTFKKLGAAARAETDVFEKGLLLDAQKRLRQVIAKKFPTYEKAVKTFSDESSVLNELSKKKNPLGALLQADDPDSFKAVQKIFNQQPEIIAKNRAFAAANNLSDAFDAGAKANILGRIDRAVNSGGTFAGVFKTPGARKQLVASVGKDNANAFQEVMKAMDDFKVFNRGLTGSQTQPLGVAGEELALAAQTKFGRAAGSGIKIASKAKDFFSQGTNKNMADFASATENPRFRQEVANLLFDRKTGKAFLKRIANPAERKKGVAHLLSTALDRVRELEPEIQRGLTGETFATGSAPIDTNLGEPRIIREGNDER